MNKLKMIGMVLAAIVAFASVGASAAQFDGVGSDDEFAGQWAYANIETMEMIVVLEMDMGDASTASMMVSFVDSEDFVSDLISSPKKARYTGEADCIAYTGRADFAESNDKVVLLMCSEGSSVFLVLAHQSIDSGDIVDLVDSIVGGDRVVDVPRGFLDVTSMLD